jgi:hypothetical protein
MKLQLHRYANLVPEHRLAALLAKPRAIEWVPLGLEVDLTELHATCESLIQGEPGDRSKWDRVLIRPVHRALAQLSRRDAADMRFWHWFSINALPNIVWERWYKRVPAPEEIPAVLEGNSALAGRFLGTASLKGVSRNQFARLWWCGETLSDGGTDYSLAEQAIGNTDLFQGIFEREFGLYPPAARACVKVLGSVKKRADCREATKRLNNVLTTIVAEALEEEDFERLLIGF